MKIKNELSKLDKDTLLDILVTVFENHKAAKRDILIRLDAKNEKKVQTQIKKDIKRIFSIDGYYVDDYILPEVIKELKKIKKPFIHCQAELRLDLLRDMIKYTYNAYGNCDDSRGKMAEFIFDTMIELGELILEQDLPPEEKKNIIRENLDLLEEEEYGLVDGYINLILDITSTNEDITFLKEELKARMKKQKNECLVETYEEMIEELENKQKTLK